MFYRRKLVLAVLERNGNSMAKAEMHQRLFSISRKQISPAYDFVPVNGKCFSFQLQHDLEMLQREGSLYFKDNVYRNFSTVSYISSLKEPDRHLLSDNEVTDNMQCAVADAEGELPVLFTMGYEGISLEKYLRRLLENRIAVLCDVRKNAFSMKFGFSKHQLKPACEAVGVQYEHMPELGIESQLRKGIAETDKSLLFRDYRERTLPANMEGVRALLKILRAEQRVALMCYEKESCHCHRGELANLIEKLSAGVYSPVHL